MPRKKPAPSANVVSIAAARLARSIPKEEKECDPFDVMETMIEMYYVTLNTQLNILRTERK
ncbi:MAG: hypothetical protein HY935_02655 [Nitrosomonadales bacterium]|nr:hypothetical protein [Nitrosomonadales bacterium]